MLQSCVDGTDGLYSANVDRQEKDGLESDRRVVQIYSLNTNKQTALVHKWDSSPSSVSFSPDGQALYLISEDDAQDKVFTISLKHDENGQIYSPDSEPAVLLDEGGTGSLQPLKDGRLLLTASSMTSLNDLYLLSPNKAVKGKHATERLTQFAARSNALSRVDFGPEPEKLTWTGAEGKEVHGWIIRPPKWDADKTYPLAVLIHGGPEGAWTNSWSTRWNPMVFAAQGFVVFTPNPTGSTGYGQGELLSVPSVARLWACF